MVSGFMYIGVMEKRMEATILLGFGFRGWGSEFGV